MWKTVVVELMRLYCSFLKDCIWKSTSALERDIFGDVAWRYGMKEIVVFMEVHAYGRNLTSNVSEWNRDCWLVIVTFRSLLGFGSYSISYHRSWFGGPTSITTRPGVASEHISHGWVVRSSSEKVETRKLLYPAEWGSDQSKTFSEWLYVNVNVPSFNFSNV